MRQLLFLPGIFAVMRGVVLRNARFVDPRPNIAALLVMSGVLVWLGARSLRKLAA